MLSKQLVRNAIETNAIIELNKCIFFWLQDFVYSCLFLFLWEKECRRGKRLNISEVSCFLIEAVRQYHCCQSVDNFVSKYLCMLKTVEKFNVQVYSLISMLEISACSSHCTARQLHSPSCVLKPFPHSLQSALVPSFAAVKEGQQVQVLRSVDTQVLQKLEGSSPQPDNAES